MKQTTLFGFGQKKKGGQLKMEGFFGANGKAKKVEKGEEEEELPRKRQRLETENEGSSQSTAVEDDTSAGIEAKEEEEEHIVQSDSEASPETEDDTPGEEEALPADTSATDLGDTPDWDKNKVVPYRALTDTFAKLEAEGGRLKMTEILTKFFQRVIRNDPDSLVFCVYLCSNSLAPAYEGVEIGVGDSFLIKAIAGTTGSQEKEIKNKLRETGDLGLIAEKSKATQRTLFEPPPLTVPHVFKSFKNIALMSGSGSQANKVGKIKSMFVACKGTEARYLIRGLQGKLRIGLAEKTVHVALATAIYREGIGKKQPATSAEGETYTFPASVEDSVNMLKQIFSEMPTYDALIPALLKGGIHGARAVLSLTPGIPISPMLAKPTKGVSEVLDRFQNTKFTVEWKYDGERAQVHVLEDGTVRVFSRNSENTTGKYPDVAGYIKEAMKDNVKSCILDGEIVAYDAEKGQFRPFQVLSTRARKDVTLENITVQVIFIAFDLIYLNGKTLIREPFIERRNLLRDHFNKTNLKFDFATFADANDTEEILAELNQAVAHDCEGLMVKTLETNASYEPCKRSLNWLKLKKDYMEGMTDSVDLVPVGAWFGKGKRTGTFGAYLMACFEADDEEFQAITKVGTGFSDEFLAEATKFFKDNEYVREKPPMNVVPPTSLVPDVWLEPAQVWEVKAADLSISPAYRAAVGHVDPAKGIALRFPRFLRIRDDKNPEHATNSEQIAQMYRDQGNVGSGGAGGGHVSDDDMLY